MVDYVKKNNADTQIMYLLKNHINTIIDESSMKKDSQGENFFIFYFHIDLI